MRRYRILCETIAQAFDTAGVKVVVKGGVATLTNIEEGTVN